MGGKKLRWKGGQGVQIRGTLGRESSLGIHRDWSQDPHGCQRRPCEPVMLKSRILNSAVQLTPSALAGLMFCIRHLPIRRFHILRLLHLQLLPSPGVLLPRVEYSGTAGLEGCLTLRVRLCQVTLGPLAVLATTFFP